MSQTDGQPGRESENREKVVADLLWEYVDRLNAGEVIEPGVIRAEHPEDAQELLVELEALKAWLPADQKEESSPLGTLGDYALRRKIGQGGMGVVYEAWQGSLDRQVALKVLPAGIAADDKAFHRFMREAKTTAKFNHANIVSVHGVGIEQNTPYYAMEYVEGETLAQAVGRIKDVEPEGETPFGPKDQVDYYAKLARAFADVADGLQHAHSRGVIHRDIKPSNLILDGAGRLRILDFGLARLEGQESLTVSGDFVGTPLYMSPEQARRKKIPVDHRTDIYSLGATMYQALTGRPPFQGKDHHDTLSQIIERDPRPPRQYVQRIPGDLETIVLKCLRKDPGDRYGTAEALGQDLRRFVRGDPVEARAEMALPRLARTLRRHRTRIIVVTALLVALIVSAILVLSMIREDYERRGEAYVGLIERAVVAIELGRRPLAVQSQNASIEAYAGDVDESPSYYGRSVLEHTLESLEEATRLMPSRPEASYQQAKALILLRREADAERKLVASLGRDPDFLPARILLEELAERMRPGGQIRSDSDDSRPRALRPWEKLWIDTMTQKEAESPDVYYCLCEELIAAVKQASVPYVGLGLEVRLRRGQVASLAQDYHQALVDFGIVHARLPEWHGPAKLLARTFFLLGDSENAKRTVGYAFDRAIFRDEAAVCFSGLFAGFGEKQEQLKMIESIADPKTREPQRLQFLMLEGKYVEALDALQHCRDLGCDSPQYYLAAAGLLNRLGRYDEQKETLEEGWTRHPDNMFLCSELAFRHFYSCDFDSAIMLMERAREAHPTSARVLNSLGFSFYRTYRLAEARDSFTAALVHYPRFFFGYYGRGKVHFILGNMEEAIQDLVNGLLLAPGHAMILQELSMLCSRYDTAILSLYWDELHRGLESAITRGITRSRLHCLLSLAAIYGSKCDIEQALSHAHTAVSETGRRDAWALDCLAQAQHAFGEREDAIRTLESSLHLPGVADAARLRLETYRDEIAPRLVSCQSIDALFMGCERLGAADFEKKLHGAQQALEKAEARSLLGYLHARSLQQEGNLETARTTLEDLLLGGKLLEEAAILRLASLRNQLGHREAAMDLLEKTTLLSVEGRASCPAWFALAGSDPALPPDALLTRPVFLAPPDDTRFDDTALEEIRWVLSQSAGTTAIRINCGGDSYVDREGRLWVEDRFFAGGRPPGRAYSCRIQNTIDEDLYVRHRLSHTGVEYRIPLPVGSYDVSLHFWDAFGPPTGCRFDVFCNGKLMLGEYTARKEGMYVVDIQRRRIDIANGLLQLRFVPLEGYVSIAAIEARRIE